MPGFTALLVLFWVTLPHSVFVLSLHIVLSLSLSLSRSRSLSLSLLLLSHPRWHPSILEQLQLLSTPRPDLPLDPGFCFWLSVFQARFVLNHLAWFQPHRLRGPVPTHTIDRFISLPPSLFAYGHASLFFASVYLSLRSAASPDSRLLIAIQSSLVLSLRSPVAGF